MKILVIIPAYNEEDSIYSVVTTLQNTNPEVDYIIINDCSTDRTQSICRKNHFNYINLPVNLGIGGGVQTGYQYAVAHKYDIALQMDGDGQHDPQYISALIQPILDGNADMVIGSRFITQDGFQSSSIRRLGISVLRNLIRILTFQKVISDPTSGFRATNLELTRFFAENYAQDYPEPEAIMEALLNGYRICEVPVIMRERQGGESSIKALKSIYYMIKVTLAITIHRLAAFPKKGRKNK